MCTTELGAVATHQQEFEKRNVKVIGFSCNNAEDHKKWINDIESVTGQQITFPLFCDSDRSHSSWLGITDDKNRDEKGLPMCTRSVYFIDPSKTIRFLITYPSTTGRNMKEIFRAIDSVLLCEDSDIATPVDWEKEDKVLVNLSLNDAQAEEKFGKEVSS